jgi:DNA processing protein
VLHILGDPGVLADAEGVGVVGARRASGYGLDVARTLGRGLSAADVTVISGLALGIDSAAHAGALEGPGRTIGVLAGSANIAYPVRGHRLHAAVAARGAVISELPPGASAHRWCFVARNRIIAALAAATVVVQATERSGSLTTADFANELGRTVAAVPGQVTTRLSSGTHSLIQAGAPLVRDTTDVLELLASTTGRVFASGPGPRTTPPDLDPRLALLLAAVEDGHGTLSELAETADEARFALSGLGELERLGLVRRGFAGRWERAAT